MPFQGDAAFGRPKTWPGDMDKDGAAAAGNARPRVVVDLDNEVVEAVVPAQPVAWFIGRALERPVVAAVCRIFAPGIAGTDSANRQRSPRARKPLGAPPQANRAKPAGWRRAVAFALVGLDAAPAERDSQRVGTGEEPTLRSPAWPGPDADGVKRSSSHRCTAPNSQPGLALVSFTA
jgi:hypothetical protein